MKNTLTITAVVVAALTIVPAGAVSSTDRTNDTNGPNDLLLAQADLPSMQAGDLVGLAVLTENQLELGDVISIARHDSTGNLYAIVTIADYWDAYGFDAALPLSDMNLVDGQLILLQERSDMSIDREADTYDSEEYTLLEDDANLAEEL